MLITLMWDCFSCTIYLPLQRLIHYFYTECSCTNTMCSAHFPLTPDYMMLLIHFAKIFDPAQKRGVQDPFIHLLPRGLRGLNYVRDIAGVLSPQKQGRGVEWLTVLTDGHSVLQSLHVHSYGFQVGPPSHLPSGEVRGQIGEQEVPDHCIL